MCKLQWLCGSAAAVITMAASGAAMAQTAAESGPRLEEVVVTARKIEENLQKAPASIVAVSGVMLEQEGITDPQELEKELPSASLRSNGPVVETFVRGVGSLLDDPNVSPAVAFVYNGIIVPRYGTSGLLFDVGSVQAIAGPQGTLYGGSAAGGAINVYSALPSNDYAGSSLLDGGAYSAAHVAINQNVPLSDTVSLRGAIDYSRHDGYQIFGFDAQNRIQSRLSLLAEPTDNVTALFFFSGSHDSGQPTASQSNPPYNSSNYYLLPPLGTAGTFQHTGGAIAGANIVWRVDGNVFTYIPGYVNVADSYNIVNVVGGNQLSARDEENQNSQELRWSRDVGAWKLSGGLFYLYNRTSFAGGIGLALSPTGPYFNIPIIDISSQADKTYAAYSQAVYSVTDRLRITVGARDSYDTISSVGFGVVGETYPPFAIHESKNTPDWKVGVDYDLAPRVLIYANAQTGYIPIGYEPVQKSSTTNPLVPESRLLGFSGGVKSRFFDRRVEINSEFFYYDYRDFQAISFNGETGVSTVLSARRSTIYGDELSVRALLPDDSEFDVRLLLQSAHYNEFSGLGYEYSENQMADAPTGNVIAGLQHDVSLGGRGDLLGRVQTHYESGHYGDYSNWINTRQSAYTKTDLVLTYTPVRADWSVQTYVENVENRAVYGTLAPGNTPATPATGALEPPRTYGVRIFTNWGGR